MSICVATKWHKVNKSNVDVCESDVYELHEVMQNYCSGLQTINQLEQTVFFSWNKIKSVTDK